MRVIAGEARGRSLEALPGTDVTRPTLSQVKEAMFSIVQFDLPGARVLDLYAGSGQLGIEALSRGAARCVFLDENREAVNIIMRNCKACGVFDRSRETGIVLPAEAGGLTLRKQYKYGRVLLWKYTKPMQPAGDEQKGEAL